MFGRPLQTPGGKWIAACGHLGPDVASDGAYDLGQYLLTNVSTTGEGCPALTRYEVPSSSILREIFGVNSLQDLSPLLGVRRRQTAALARGRLPTNATAPAAHTNIELLENVQARVFKALEREGIDFRPNNNRPQPTGPQSNHQGNLPLEELEPLMPGWLPDYWAEGLMSLYGRTFWQKIPNQRGGLSWLVPDAVEEAQNLYGIKEWRHSVLRIKQRFRCVRFETCQAKWDHAFRICFASDPSQSGRKLSFQPCRGEWLRVITKLDPASQERVIALMRAKFNTLTAVPDIRHDKWCTSTKTEGPCLLVNPSRQPCDHRSGYLTLAEMVALDSGR